MSLMRIAESVHTREQHIGHHRVARQRKGKQQGGATAPSKRLSSRKSATAPDRFSILCDSQKHTTCLDIQYSGRLKHTDFLNHLSDC